MAFETPKNLGDIKTLKMREEKARAREHQWHSLLDDAYEYFLPNRNLFNNPTKGSSKTDRIFDSTAPLAIKEGVNKVVSSIVPAWQIWAQTKISEAVISELDIDEQEVNKALEEQNKIVFDYINRSNFSTQINEMLLDIFIGTGTIRVDDSDDDANPLIFSTAQQNTIYFEEGPRGTIETHWRTVKHKAIHLERLYRGFEASEEVKEIVSNNPYDDVKLKEGVVYDPKENKYWGVVWVDGEDRLSWAEDFGSTSPLISGRWSKVSGEVRGRGPAIDVLPDVKTLNKVKEFLLQKAAIDLCGIFTATNDGVTNPYNIVLQPNVVIPVGSNDSSNPSLSRLDTRSDLQLTQFEISELRTNIKTALFNDLRDPSSPVRSATEIAIEANELADRIGSAFGRLQTEVLIPILNRVYSILRNKGLISLELGGVEFDVKFTSPLARAQDFQEILAVQQAVEFTLNTSGPEQVQMSFKTEEFGTWAANKTGVPSELIRTETEKRKVVEAGAEMAQQQMGAQNGLE